MNKLESIYDMYLRKALVLMKKPNSKEEYKNNLADWLIKKVEKNSNEICDRCKNYLDALEKEYISAGKHVISCEMTSTSRVIADISSPFAWLIDEVGLSWDPLLDAPTLPGIKGAVRAAAEWLADTQKVEAIFGKAGEEEAYLSLLAFTEAYPIKPPADNKILVRDIITPIYSLEKNAIEEHRAEPTPIQLVAINRGVTFRFLVILNSDYKTLVEKACKTHKVNNYPEGLRPVLEKYVRKAAEDLGFGAKTSSGYGIFRIEKITLRR